MKNKLTKLEFKWICYDMGNSAFILLVATILPIYFNYLSSSQGVAEHNYLSYWSYAASLSTLIVALAGPILGTLADYKDHKKKIFLTCAGGTGAFIDQMATLLNMSLEEMNEASLNYHRLYPIASRCGVFAKTDIQPLINQGVDKCDLCAIVSTIPPSKWKA